VIKQQERLLTDRDTANEDLTRRMKGSQEEGVKLKEEVARLRREMGVLESKLEESNRLIESNQQVRREEEEKEGGGERTWRRRDEVIDCQFEVQY